MTTVLCIGATGSIARYVVDEAVRQGYSVRALVRDRESAPRWPAQVEIVVGDVMRSESLPRAVADIDAVIFVHGTYGGDQHAAETVDYGAVRNVLTRLARTKPLSACESPGASAPLMTPVDGSMGVASCSGRGCRLLQVR